MDSIKSAYRKLKSYIYYDNTSLLLRRQLAEYEASGEIEKKLQELSSLVLDFSSNTQYWEALAKSASYWTMAKSFVDPIEDAMPGVITNTEGGENYEVDRCTHIINAPIELHICCAWWVIKRGYLLQEMMDIPPYANLIEIQKSSDGASVVDGLRLYRPYFHQYQKWRDRAIGAAKRLISDERDALIIGLDFKDFYHSLHVDLSKIRSDTSPGADLLSDNLQSIIELLHIEYSRIHGEASILPIGLISSGVIANWALKDFDWQMRSSIRPEFYGRYVDDVLIVVNYELEEGEIFESEKVIRRFLLENNVFEKKGGGFNLSSLKSIEVQKDKLSILHFSKDESSALIDKFVKDIRKNSSEYRLLPEDELISSDFDEAAYNLKYSGSGNKLRDIKEFGEDKFGISKYLAKKIFLVLQSDSAPDDDAIKKVVRFFKGRRAIDLYRLWEKVFTFFVVCGRFDCLADAYQGIEKAIDRLAHISNEDGLKGYYKRHLAVALVMALSLCPSRVDKDKRLKKLEKAIAKELSQGDSFISDSIKAIRRSNLVRHNYVMVPLLNYTSPTDDGYVDLVGNARWFSSVANEFSIGSEMYKYSPRFVHFHEVSLFTLFNRVPNLSGYPVSHGLKSNKREDVRSGSYLDAAFDDFYRLNYLRSPTISSDDFPDLEERRSQIYRRDPPDGGLTKLHVGAGNGKVDPVIGIANLRLDEEVFSHKYMREPIVKDGRRGKINKLLNEAQCEAVDILAFPESSIPVRWLVWVADEARRKGRAMVFGLEHWISSGHAYNFIVTLLPVEYEGIPTVVVSVRLKNHYAPSEMEILEGYGYKVPKVAEGTYDIFCWQKMRFTVVNCFELCNIEHRSALRSKIDFLVASEANSDIGYFSNIVESSTRDIHCYVVQVNDSKYGDSRITRPVKSEEKDQIKVKGGRNAVLLVDQINVSQLREFQLKEYAGQRLMGVFKPTPPDFDKNEVYERMGNRWTRER